MPANCLKRLGKAIAITPFVEAYSKLSTVDSTTGEELQSCFECHRRIIAPLTIVERNLNQSA